MASGKNLSLPLTKIEKKNNHLLRRVVAEIKGLQMVKDLQCHINGLVRTVA